MLSDVKNKFKTIKTAQWFLDPLTRKGPDYAKNKSRILDKEKSCDTNFLTTDPGSLDFRLKNSFYIQLLFLRLHQPYTYTYKHTCHMPVALILFDLDYQIFQLFP